MFFHRRIKTTRKWAHKKESLNEMCALVNGKERWKTKESPFIINIIRIKNERAVCDSREIKCNAERIHAHPHEVPCLVGRVTYTDTWQPVVSQIIWSERERELKQKKKLEDASAEFISLEIYQKKKNWNDLKISKRNQRQAAKSVVRVTEIGYRERYATPNARTHRHASVCAYDILPHGILLLLVRLFGSKDEHSAFTWTPLAECMERPTLLMCDAMFSCASVDICCGLSMCVHFIWRMTMDAVQQRIACAQEKNEGIKRKPKRKMISCEITMRSRAERERARCICVLYVQLEKNICCVACSHKMHFIFFVVFRWKKQTTRCNRIEMVCVLRMMSPDDAGQSTVNPNGQSKICMKKRQTY